MNRPTGNRNGDLIAFDAAELTAWRDELRKRIAAYEESSEHIVEWRADLAQTEWLLGDG